MYYYRVCNAKGFYDFLTKHLACEIHLNNVNCERKENFRMKFNKFYEEFIK